LEKPPTPMAITTTVRPTFANGPSAGRFRKTAAVFPGFATTGLPPTFGRPSVPGTWVPLDPDRSGAVESERRGIDPGGPGGSATDPGGGGGGAARIDIGGMDCERWPGMGKGGAAPPLTGRGGSGGEGDDGGRGGGGAPLYSWGGYCATVILGRSLNFGRSSDSGSAAATGSGSGKPPEGGAGGGTGGSATAMSGTACVNAASGRFNRAFRRSRPIPSPWPAPGAGAGCSVPVSGSAAGPAGGGGRGFRRSGWGSSLIYCRRKP